MHGGGRAGGVSIHAWGGGMHAWGRGQRGKYACMIGWREG